MGVSGVKLEVTSTLSTVVLGRMHDGVTKTVTTAVQICGNISVKKYTDVIDQEDFAVFERQKCWSAFVIDKGLTNFHEAFHYDQTVRDPREQRTYGGVTGCH